MAAAFTFGGWLKRRRMGLGLTQKELARRVGYAVVTLRKVEADELRPSGQMARKLAEAMELAPEEQAQFVRFARDEAYWDDIALPERAPATPVPTERPAESHAPGAQQRGDTFDSARAKHNLPAQTTSLIGREEELAELAQLLTDPGARLVTILSAGGMGKTHLATAAAWQQVERFAHGVRWVPLAPLTEARELVLAIAAALDLQLQGERTPEQQVGDYLQSKHLLLVLDNFEHLLEGAALVGELLAKAPQLWILVTSRQRLKLSSEAVIFLDGLRFPADDATDPFAYPAVQLFLLHAGRVRPHYQPHADDVAGMVAVCRLVYGMPLGVLLAAAWSGVILPAQIAAEVGKDLGFLQSDMPDVPVRQRNLRAVFLHTWSRLSAAERNVFMRMSVFRGGATLDAARQVTDATLDVLGGLIDKALLRRLPSGRFEVHELLRQFAAERLVADGAEDDVRQSDAQRQHSSYYLNLLSEQERPLQGPQQRAALDIVRADLDNIGVAWRWALQAREFDLLTQAIHALFLFCEVRGNFRDGVILFEDAATGLSAALAEGAGHQPTLRVLQGRIFVRLGICEIMAGHYQRSVQLLQDGFALVTQDWERAFTLTYLGLAAAERGEIALAHARLNEGLAISRRIGDLAGMARAMHRLQGGVSDYAEVCRVCTESLALARKAERPDLIAAQLNFLGWGKVCLGDYAGASACWHEGMDICDKLGQQEEKAWALDCIGFAAWCQGEMAVAARYLEEALTIFTELGHQRSIGMCMADLALVLACMGHIDEAISLARRAVALTHEINSPMMLTLSLNHLGAALLAAGDLAEARHTLREAVVQAWEHRYTYNLMTAFYYFAELLAAESRRAAPTGALERKCLALTLLSCVLIHTATWQIYRDKAAELRAQLETTLPAEVVTAAVENGKKRTVEELIDTLLASEPPR